MATTTQVEDLQHLVGLSAEARRAIVERLNIGLSALGLIAACEALCDELALCQSDVHPWQVYAIAADLAPNLIDQQACYFEAIYMLGRIDMKAAVGKQEARRRSANARKGGAPVKVSDEEIRTAHAADARRYPDGRGVVKRLGAELGLDPKTISKRLRDLNLRE